MFIEERHNEILRILQQEGSVYVKDLSIRFNLSEPMIRKDLQKLESEGKLKRTYGGAIFERKKAQTTDIGTRLFKNIDIKTKIAEKVYEQINDGDVIFLDISSINYLLAKSISKGTKKMTIITNMVEITSLFYNNSHIEIICIGGRYNNQLGGVVGSTAIENIIKYKTDKAFIGSCGVNVYEKYISNFDLEEGNTKKAIMNCSKKVYVVIENEKFNFDGSYRFSSIDNIHAIITEEKPSEEISNILHNNKIQVH